MWSFTGRYGEVELLRKVLREGRGALVTGEAGSGRTRLLSEAVAPFEHWMVRGRDPEVPFGAFAHLLPVPGETANPVRWAADALGLLPELLAVDDAHLLDPLSAALVDYLAAQSCIKLLLSAREGVPLPRLATEPHTLELRPLSLQETGRVLAAVLRGPMDAFSVRRLWNLTQGNLLLLTEIVRSVPPVSQNDAWSWEGRVIRTRRIRRWVDERFSVLDPATREVLEYIAVSEPLDLEAITDPAAMERLEQARLVQIFGSPPRVKLAHPLFAEVIRSGMGQLRTRRLIAELPPARSGAGPLSARELEIARLASWGLSNREIAECLSLSRRTVANHLCTAYAKLGCNDRAMLARRLPVG